MDMMDKNLEQSVWQRVRPCAPASREPDLRSLELAAEENRAVYRHLRGMVGSRGRQSLCRLAEENHRERAILRGLQGLSAQRVPEAKPATVDPGPARDLLRGCFHRSRQAAAEYTAREVDGEVGCVFRYLRELAQNQCALIAQCLGEVL